MPCKRLTIVNVQIIQVLGLLARILEATKEQDIPPEIDHAMTASCRGALTFGLELRPLPRPGLQAPKVVVVVECSLFGTAEFAAKEVQAAGVASSAHGMAATREWRIGRGDFAPFVVVGLVYVQITRERC